MQSAHIFRGHGTLRWQLQQALHASDTHPISKSSDICFESLLTIIYGLIHVGGKLFAG
jgi:hypothetical protein